jgi:hypothetical protein
MLSAALTGGSILPEPNEDLTWSRALATRECEYWITGACKEFSSLDDLKVFALVPCSGERLTRFDQALASLLKC